jgi:putative spermidine/putrescine transport system permease protein
VTAAAIGAEPERAPSRSLSERFKDPALLLLPAVAFLSFIYL